MKIIYAFLILFVSLPVYSQTKLLTRQEAENLLLKNIIGENEEISYYVHEELIMQKSIALFYGNLESKWLYNDSCKPDEIILEYAKDYLNTLKQ